MFGCRQDLHQGTFSSWKLTTLWTVSSICDAYDSQLFGMHLLHFFHFLTPMLMHVVFLGGFGQFFMVLLVQ